ncbi:hypothetical protein [Thermomonas sp. HDW16]|uniref:hypothetical protein n=1 Tax=Thermomonas sp. HDW16 TaxID=2714945 RepID=UPI00140A65AD|nr:hypothetical protein [Thermomonas sp. HDW16]QIL19244.1 hypothetical protein G7079_08790 [Thermomonas sp. HDW16]
MPRQKKPAPAPATIPPSKTTHLFASRKPVDRNALTHERIASDLEAFRKAGGKIEVLGVTRTLKKIGPDADDAPPPAPAKSRR